MKGSVFSIFCLAGCVKCFMMAVSIFVLPLADLDLILRVATEAV